MYISYTSLSATVNCVLTDAVRTGRIYNTLVAYPPEALSTQACIPLTVSDDPFTFESGFKAINYTQMEQQTDFCSDRDYTVLGNTNAWTSQSVPFYLSFPPGLSLIDPAWKSCKNFVPGVLDPPRTLNKATALVGLGLGASQTSTAAPGAKPIPSQVAATPTPTAIDGANSAAGPPIPPPSSQESDAPIGDPGKDIPPKEVDPPAIPVSNTIPNLPLGGSNPESPPNANDPQSPGGNGGEDPQGAGGSNEGDPNTPPANGDSSLPSIGDHQIQKEEGGGIVFGSTTLLPGDQTTQDGTSLSIGSDRIIIGDSTIPLAAPTGHVSESNPVVMAAPDPVIIDGSTVNRLPGGGVLIAGSTYSPGADTTISGTAVSVAADSLVIDGVTQTLPSENNPTPILVGGQTIAKASNGGVMIGGSTYLPGTQADVFGTALSVGADDVVVGGSTYAIPTYPTGKPVVIDGKPITRAPNGGVVIGGSTIAPGSQVVVSGHTISAGFSSVVVDGSTYALPTYTVSPNAFSQSITLANGAIISAGGSAVTLSGTTYSIASDRRALIVNGKTIGFPTGSNLVFTIAGQTFTANPTGFAIDSHSILRDGSAITLSGTVISLGPSGLQIGSSTIPLAFAQETSALQSVFTMAGQTFTANPTGFAVDGHSVSVDGSAVTLSGTVVSLGPDGLQIDSTTWPLTPAEETAEVGLGGLIMSGFGKGADSAGTSTAANVSSPLAFTGGSPRLRDAVWCTILAAFGTGIGLVAYAL